MKKEFVFFMMAVIAAMTTTGCEKPLYGDVEGGNVTLRFSSFSIEPMTRSSNHDISEAFTKLNVQMFKAGTTTKAFDKVKTQTSDDPYFGTMTFSLPEGDYDVLCVGHSSERSATLATDKVSFTASNGRKITDTFWYWGMIEVRGEDENIYDITLNRATALFRIVITDDAPYEVSQFRFDYTGGSADFHPVSGCGVSNSKQTEQRDFADEYVYDVYTFPKDDKKLTVNAYAMDANGNIISQRQFVDVPIKARYITTYRGKFFDGATGIINGNQLVISVNDEWEGHYEGEF